jgi:hypothetical protein
MSRNPFHELDLGQLYWAETQTDDLARFLKRTLGDKPDAQKLAATLDKSLVSIRQAIAAQEPKPDFSAFDEGPLFDFDGTQEELLVNQIRMESNSFGAPAVSGEFWCDISDKASPWKNAARRMLDSGAIRIARYETVPCYTDGQPRTMAVLVEVEQPADT